MLEHLSVTQLTTYLGCPRRFAYRYVDKAEPERRSSALAMGIAVHGALRWLLEERMAGEFPDHQALEATFVQRWREATEPGGFAESEDELAALCDLGMRLVGTYRDADPDFVPDDTETRMVVDLVDPRSGEPLRPLLAFADAIAGDTLVEFKTSSRKTHPAAWRLQLSAYRLAFRQLRDVVPRLKVVQLVKTKTPQVLIDEVELTDRDEAWLCEVAAEVSDAIDAGAFFPNPSWMCGGCEYRKRCGAA